jgi:hypothetical protein
VLCLEYCLIFLQFALDTAQDFDHSLLVPGPIAPGKFGKTIASQVRDEKPE